MHLKTWLEAGKYGAVSGLSRKSGVSMLTIRRVRDGYLLRDLGVARKLSDATGGKVLASSLLHPDLIHELQALGLEATQSDETAAAATG